MTRNQGLPLADTLRGVDISMTKEVEALGGTYYLNGEPRDLFDILHEQGVNYARVRLWVNPYDTEGQPYQGGTNDLDNALELAARIKAKGMQLLLDLHYSDFWTDPKKQSKPKAWANLSGSALEDAVYRYTMEVLEAFAAKGLLPDHIQIGNEITNGMLWPDGKTPVYLPEERRFETWEIAEHAAAYDRLAGLLQAGLRAVRDHSGLTIRTILHLEQGAQNPLYRAWFEEITRRGVDFDIIGLSFYPFWHGSLDDLRANLEDISQRYDKDVLVVETAYGFTTESPPGSSNIFTSELAAKGGYPATVDGQYQFLTDLIDTVRGIPDGRGLGIVYWEPAWLPVQGTSWASLEGMKYGDDVVGGGGNPWANQGLFDFKGNALSSLAAFSPGRKSE